MGLTWKRQAICTRASPGNRQAQSAKEPLPGNRQGPQQHHYPGSSASNSTPTTSQPTPGILNNNHNPLQLQITLEFSLTQELEQLLHTEKF